MITIGCIIVWQVVGGLLLLFLCATSADGGWLRNCDGWEFVNPYWCYKLNKRVNIIGAIVLALMLTAMCPAGAVFYWFYKLCTFGRKR